MAEIKTFDSINISDGELEGAIDMLSTMTGVVKADWEPGTIGTNGADASNVKYYRTKNYIPVSGGDRLTVFTRANTNRFYIFEYDSSKEFIQRTIVASTFRSHVLQTNTAYIRFAIYDTGIQTADATITDGVYAILHGRNAMIHYGQIPTGTNLDDLRVNGIWHITVADVAASPAKSNGNLLVIANPAIGAGEDCTQFFIGVDGITLARRYVGGAWSKWASKVAGLGQTISSDTYADFGITNVTDIPDGVTYISATITDEMVSGLPETNKSQTIFKQNGLPGVPNGSLYIDVTYNGNVYAGMYYTDCVWWKNLTEESQYSEVGAAEDDVINHLPASFKSFAVVGDSMAAGHVYPNPETTSGNIDNKSIAWGTFMARKLNTTCHIFAKGGMTCKGFIDGYYNGHSADGNDLEHLLDGEHDVPLYYIGLGLNDVTNGSTASIDLEDKSNNLDDYYGNYAYIVQSIIEHYSADQQPFIVMITPPFWPGSSVSTKAQHIRNIYNYIKGLGNIYLMDLQSDYASLFDANSQIYLDNINNHLTSVGYNACGTIIARAMGKLMYENMADFSRIEWLTANDYIS